MIFVYVCWYAPYLTASNNAILNNTVIYCATESHFIYYTYLTAMQGGTLEDYDRVPQLDNSRYDNITAWARYFEEGGVVF